MARKKDTSEKTFPIAILVWEDAAFFFEASSASTIFCHSVGYLLENNKSRVQLAMEVSENGPRDVLTVPRAYVRQLRIIEKDTIKISPFRLEVKHGRRRV